MTFAAERPTKSSLYVTAAMHLRNPYWTDLAMHTDHYPDRGQEQELHTASPARLFAVVLGSMLAVACNGSEAGTQTGTAGAHSFDGSVGGDGTVTSGIASGTDAGMGGSVGGGGASAGGVINVTSASGTSVQTPIGMGSAGGASGSVSVGGAKAVGGALGSATVPGGGNSSWSSAGANTGGASGATGGTLAIASGIGGATGGTSAIASGVGGATSATSACPAYSPRAGDACATGTVCSYDESTSKCSRVSRSRCVGAKWVLEVPIGCPRPSGIDSCPINGNWRISYPSGSPSYQGVPGPKTYAVVSDASGQAYVSLYDSVGFTGWDLSYTECKLTATSTYDATFAPSDGSNCGVISTRCTLALAFAGDGATGTLTCVNHDGHYSCGGSSQSVVDATATRTPTR